MGLEKSQLPQSSPDGALRRRKSLNETTYQGPPSYPAGRKAGSPRSPLPRGKKGAGLAADGHPAGTPGAGRADRFQLSENVNFIKTCGIYAIRSQGVGAAGGGRVKELCHRLVLLLGQGEPSGGEPPRHVPPREVGGTHVNPNWIMKRSWPSDRRPLVASRSEG